LEIKKEKLIIGLALTGIGLLVSEIKNRKKLGMLTERLNNTEDFLEDLEEKTWSLNRSMKEIAKSHNSLIKMRIGDYEDFDERFYEIEDEIATIYSHLEELNKLKKNRKDVSKDLAILNNDPNEFGDNTGESEEE
jgi:Mg2+ and Co2+ transporter CorA